MVGGNGCQVGWLWRRILSPGAENWREALETFGQEHDQGHGRQPSACSKMFAAGHERLIKAQR